MNNQHYIAILFKKYLANDCTAGEVDVLIDFIRSGQEKAFVENLISQHLQEEATGTLLHQVASDRIFKRLELKQTSATVPARRSFSISPFLKVAAAVVVILTGSYFMYTFFAHSTRDNGLAKVAQDVAPGGNRATLVLSDGQQVTLSDMQVGNITEDGGAIIKKSADGQLAYFTSETGRKLNAVNTVKTPKGGQYQVILPDGSKVWLNAASSITYPAAFNADVRRVQLTGEAYFEITTMLKNQKKVPFIVETNKQKIEVLGTRFNVNAYDDEAGTKTTLIEGKVKVTTENETVILKPNQEFDLQAEGISTKKVDVEPAIDWKNGDFIFADENVRSIMRKIARWYNVDVVYETDIPEENIKAEISRDRNLSEVLRMLELSCDTKFRIENGAGTYCV